MKSSHLLFGLGVMAMVAATTQPASADFLDAPGEALCSLLSIGCPPPPPPPPPPAPEPVAAAPAPVKHVRHAKKKKKMVKPAAAAEPAPAATPAPAAEPAPK